MLLHHESSGLGEETLVLLHLGAADMRMWDEAWALLRRPGRRLVRLDLPGFGRSPAAGGAHAPAEAVRATLDALGVERAAVVGTSYGGAVALDLALRHPDRVDALVLCAPALPGAPRGEDVRAVGEAEARLAGARDVDGLVELGLRTWLDGRRAPGSAGGVLRERARRWVRDAVARDLAGDQGEAQVVADDLVPLLPTVRARTLVLVGEHDLETMHANARLLAERVLGARLAVLPGVAHFVGAERPEAFAREVEAFLAGDAAP